MRRSGFTNRHVLGWILFGWVVLIGIHFLLQMGAVADGALETKELYFAQLADGAGYATQFLLVNPTNNEITGTLDLFRSDGSPLVITVNGNSNSTFPVLLPARGTLFFKSASNSSQLQTGWARVRTTATIGGALIYSYSANGQLIEEAGLDPSAPASRFHLSVDTRHGYLAGLAVVNPNPTPVNLTLTLKNSSGIQLAETTSRLNAMQHFAKLVEELFPGQNLTSFVGTITVAAAEGMAVGTTLRFDSGLNVLASIPVIDINTNPEPNNLYFPQIADGGGYNTAFTFVNPGTTTVTATLEFFKQDGTSLTLNLGGQADTRFVISIPGGGSAFLQTGNTGTTIQTGWARLQGNGPLGGLVIYAYQTAGQTLAEAGMNPALAVSDFVLPVNLVGDIQAGLAVANPANSGSVNVTLLLYDSEGRQAGSSASRELGPRKQFAELIEQLFPHVNLENFSGSLVVKSSSGKLIGTTLRFDRKVSVLSSIPVISGLSIPWPVTTTSTSLAPSTTVTTTSVRPTTTTLPAGNALGSLESPENGQTVSGLVKGSGWAFLLNNKTGVLPAKVELKMDGVVAATAALGISRPDVRSFYADRGISVPENTGFSFSWNSYSYLPGPHALAIQVTDGAGQKNEIAHISVTIPGVNLPAAGDLYATDSMIGNLRYIPSGTFNQGSPSSDAGRLPEEKQFKHTLTKNLASMETEVTRGMWAALRATQPSLPADPTDTVRGSGNNHPVQKVTWYEAVLFANLLSKQVNRSVVYYKEQELTHPVDAGNYTDGIIYADWNASGYRLPTEGEWEYMVRAGITGPHTKEVTAYNNSTNVSCKAGDLAVLEGLAWFCANRGNGTHEVGGKNPNAWNLRDTQGNVWEWVWDWSGVYPQDSAVDYRGAATGTSRIKRGGSWNNYPRSVRVSERGRHNPSLRCDNLGFRLVRTTLGIDLFTANPENVKQGESSTLTWKTSQASTCSLDQAIGNVACNGSRSVTPAATTTYTLTATGVGTVSRSVRICGVSAISPGQIIHGALTAGDCLSTIRSGGMFADRYSFTGTVGQMVTLLLTSPDFNNYVYLIGPDGTEISSQGWMNVTRIPYYSGFLPLPSNGTYVIEVTSASSNTTGNYALSLSSGSSGCTYTITPTSQTIGAAGGNGSVSVATDAGCIWQTISPESWISIPSGTAGSGNGTVNYTVAANTNINARSGSLLIADKTLTVNQSGCASIVPASQGFNAEGGTGSVQVTTVGTCPWTSSSSLNWVSITTGSSGQGNGTITYQVAANTAPAARSGTLTLAGQKFTISQGGTGGTCTVMPVLPGQVVNGALTSGDCLSTFRGGGMFADRYSFAGTTGQMVAILLNSPDYYNYVYLIGPDGTEISSQGWSNTSRIPYYSGFLRLPSNGTYIIEVTSASSNITGNYTFSLSSGSAGCTYAITPASQTMSAGGGNGSVSVTAGEGCIWQAISMTSWISITSGTSGNGNGTVNYTVAVNANTSSRSGTLLFGDKSLTISQSGCSSIAPTGQGFNAEGGSGNIQVTTVGDCTWTSSSSLDWVSITAGSSGRGNGSISYNVASNSASVARSGTITAAGQAFTVSQGGSGGTCTAMPIVPGQAVNGALTGGDCLSTIRGGTMFADRYSFVGTLGQMVTLQLTSPDYYNYVYLIGPDGAEISSQGWTYTSRIPYYSGFLRLPSSGTYFIEVTSASSNTTGNYTLSLSSGSAGCTYSITPTSQIIGAGGGNGSVSVATGEGCIWQAISLTSWISITSGTNGNGNGTVHYTVAANTKTGSRSGTLVLGDKSLTVNQSGCASFTPTGQGFNAEGGTGSIQVATVGACSWTASSNLEWISITAGSSGQGNGTITYTVAANSALVARSGILTIAGEEFTISQGGTGGTCLTMPILPGQAVNGALTGGDCLSTIRSGKMHADRYSFTGNVGQMVAILLNSPGFYNYVYLLGPDGNEISSQGWMYASRIPYSSGFFRLPSSGTFVIEATSASSSTTGDYTLGLVNGSAGCTYTITPSTSQSIGAAGGSGSVSVTAGEGCTWQAISMAGWISITSGSGGSGKGTVNYTVAANANVGTRSGILLIGDKTFTVNQSGITSITQAGQYFNAGQETDR